MILKLVGPLKCCSLKTLADLRTNCGRIWFQEFFICYIVFSILCTQRDTDIVIEPGVPRGFHDVIPAPYTWFTVLKLCTVCYERIATRNTL